MSKPDTNLNNLQKLIDSHIADMLNESPTDYPDVYAAKVEQLTKLIGTKETLAQAKSKARFFTGDALASAVASIAGIAMIVGHERAAVVTSQAIKFVAKLR